MFNKRAVSGRSKGGEKLNNRMRPSIQFICGQMRLFTNHCRHPLTEWPTVCKILILLPQLELMFGMCCVLNLLPMPMLLTNLSAVIKLKISRKLCKCKHTETMKIRQFTPTNKRHITETNVR